MIAAAGVGYIYARKDINERRRKQAALGTRPTEKLDCASHLSSLQWTILIIHALTGQAKVEQSVSATQAPITSDGVPRATSSPDPPDSSSNAQK